MNTKILSILCLTLFWVSCSQDENLSYSCDPAANAWVKSNLSEIRAMDRAKWLKLDSKVQLASYRAFSKEQKIAFWKGKLTEAMTLDWSKDELAHIQKVLDFVNRNQDLFNDDLLSEEQNNEVEIFAYQWMKYATDSLGWDKRVVYAIAYTGYPVISRDGELGMRPSIEERVEHLDTREEQEVGDCDCMSGNTFDCFEGSNECKNIKCIGTFSGCGWLKVQSCTGQCGI